MESFHFEFTDLFSYRLFKMFVALLFIIIQVEVNLLLSVILLNSIDTTITIAIYRNK